MEEDRAVKQGYLTEEIIEKGLDGEAFTIYCESIKGTEIDLYTLEELKDIVKAFQSQNLPSDTHYPESEPIIPEGKCEEISVPDSQVDCPKLTPRLELKKESSIKINENSAYSIEAIKMQDNDLSLEEVISIELGP
jgi:hypothetical protein